MDSIQGKASLARAEFEKLVLGDGGLQSLAKVLLDIANVGFKVLNTEVGKTVLTFTAFVGIITALNAVAKSTIGIKVAQWFIGIADAIMLATSGTIGWGMALTALGLNPTILAIAGLATALIVAKKAYDHFNVTLEEQQELVESNKSKIKELQDEYNKLDANKANLTKTEEKRLELLEAQLTNLKAQNATALEKEYEKYQEKGEREKENLGFTVTDFYIKDYTEKKDKSGKTLAEDNKIKEANEVNYIVLPVNYQLSSINCQLSTVNRQLFFRILQTSNESFTIDLLIKKINFNDI